MNYFITKNKNVQVWDLSINGSQTWTFILFNNNDGVEDIQMWENSDELGEKTVASCGSFLSFGLLTGYMVYGPSTGKLHVFMRDTPSVSPIFSDWKYWKGCSRMPLRMAQTKIWPINGCRRGKAQLLSSSHAVQRSMRYTTYGIIMVWFIYLPFPAANWYMTNWNTAIVIVLLILLCSRGSKLSENHGHTIFARILHSFRRVLTCNKLKERIL